LRGCEPQEDGRRGETSTTSSLRREEEIANKTRAAQYEAESSIKMPREDKSFGVRERGRTALEERKRVKLHKPR